MIRIIVIFILIISIFAVVISGVALLSAYKITLIENRVGVYSRINTLSIKIGSHLVMLRSSGPALCFLFLGGICTVIGCILILKEN